MARDLIRRLGSKKQQLAAASETTPARDTGKRCERPDASAEPKAAMVRDRLPWRLGGPGNFLEEGRQEIMANVLAQQHRVAFGSKTGFFNATLRGSLA